MGSKAAKVAGIVEKYANIVKSAGNTLKQWTLQKLPNDIKGIFGKKPVKQPKSLTQKIDEAIQAQKRAESEYEVLRQGNKTIAHDDIKTISGWSEKPNGYSDISPETVKNYSKEINHEMKSAGGLDQKNRGGFDGKYNSSHAEKQLLTEKPNEPLGVSRTMCDDCQKFASKQAVKTQEHVVVADPNGVHIFDPNGTHVFIPK